MVTSPQVSWLFFKARAKRPYLSHTGRASNAEKQPTGRGPEGCFENGPAAALLVGYVSIEICALLAPCRRPILNATPPLLYARRYTSTRPRSVLFSQSWRVIAGLTLVFARGKSEHRKATCPVNRGRPGRESRATDSVTENIPPSTIQPHFQVSRKTPAGLPAV